MSYLPEKKISPGSPAIATAQIVPKICQSQPPTVYSECSIFHPNLFTFGRVIADCVNTAKMRHTVNPIFGWSLASSRIKWHDSANAAADCNTPTHRCHIILSPMKNLPSLRCNLTSKFFDHLLNYSLFLLFFSIIHRPQWLLGFYLQQIHHHYQSQHWVYA